MFSDLWFPISDFWYFTILVIFEDFSSFYPPSHYVLKDSRSIKSWLAWHLVSHRVRRDHWENIFFSDFLRGKNQKNHQPCGEERRAEIGGQRSEPQNEWFGIFKHGAKSMALRAWCIAPPAQLPAFIRTRDWEYLKNKMIQTKWYIFFLQWMQVEKTLW
jgi:hypothetical protein